MMSTSQYISRSDTMRLNDKHTFYKISKLLFISYMIIFVWVVIFKCNWIDDLRITHRYISSITFYERVINVGEIQSLIYRVQTGEIFHRSILEPFLNIVIFVPVGMYVTLFQNKKRIFNTYLVSLAISFATELIQLGTMIGGFSYLDIITNVTGGLIGYFIYRILYNEKRFYGLSIASISVMSLLAPIAVFAIINTILNMEFYIDVTLRRL